MYWYGVYLTGRMIKSYTDSAAAAAIDLSATSFVFRDATICIDFSTEATTTSTLARLKISTSITTSISSDPFAMGTRTCKIISMSVQIKRKTPTGYKMCNDIIWFGKRAAKSKLWKWLRNKKNLEFSTDLKSPKW